MSLEEICEKQEIIYEKEIKILCLHQLFRPNIKNPMKRDGYGDCYTCKFDPENNIHCRGYKSIKVILFNTYFK